MAFLDDYTLESRQKKLTNFVLFQHIQHRLLIKDANVCYLKKFIPIVVKTGSDSHLNFSEV